MLQHRCQIEFALSTQPFSILTSIVEKLYKKMEADPIWRQFVVFATFCNKVQDFSSCLKAYLNLKGYTGNVSSLLWALNTRSKICTMPLYFSLSFLLFQLHWNPVCCQLMNWLPFDSDLPLFFLAGHHLFKCLCVIIHGIQFYFNTGCCLVVSTTCFLIKIIILGS